MLKNHYVIKINHVLTKSPSFVSDALHVVVQSSGEVTSSKVERGSPRQDEEEDHQGSHQLSFNAKTKDEQLY